MADATAGGSTRGMTYAQARRLVIAAGLLLLALITAFMYARRVDTVEILAVLLFVPVFLAFISWSVTGGAVAGLLASVAYAFARADDLQVVSNDNSIIALIANRTIGYLMFGVAGGWAAHQLEQSLTKLELYDHIDDATGLNNARFFLQDTDLEMARATRYNTLFSVAVVSFPAAALAPLGRRKAAAAVRAFGQMLKESVRTVDRAVHARDDHRHRFAVILPETAEEGAVVFATRLGERAQTFLRDRGVTVSATDVETAGITFPGDEAAMAALRDTFARIEQTEHPAHPVGTQG